MIGFKGCSIRLFARKPQTCWAVEGALGDTSFDCNNCTGGRAGLLGMSKRVFQGHHLWLGKVAWAAWKAEACKDKACHDLKCSYAHGFTHSEFFLPPRQADLQLYPLWGCSPCPLSHPIVLLCCSTSVSGSKALSKRPPAVLCIRNAGDRRDPLAAGAVHC